LRHPLKGLSLPDTIRKGDSYIEFKRKISFVENMRRPEPRTYMTGG